MSKRYKADSLFLPLTPTILRFCSGHASLRTCHNPLHQGMHLNLPYCLKCSSKVKTEGIFNLSITAKVVQSVKLKPLSSIAPKDSPCFGYVSIGNLKCCRHYRVKQFFADFYCMIMTKSFFKQVQGFNHYKVGCYRWKDKGSP